MILNDYFSKIYCLNLDRRTDRWTEVQKEFQKHNLEVERYPAFDWQLIFPNTEYDQKYRATVAHLRSFVDFFKLAITQDLENVLLLEDDVVFTDFLSVDFKRNIKQVPDDWMMLFFGGNHTAGHTPISENIIKCQASLSTHAIVYKRAAFETIIYNLEHHLDRIMNMTPPNKYLPIVSADVWLAILQQVLPTYSFNPPLAWQKSGYSDIEMQYADSDHILKYNL